MRMRRGPVVAMLVAAWAAAPPLLAGPRIAPVPSNCNPERPQREVDVDGLKDRCVARTTPTCPSGTELKSDVNGEADACLAGGSSAGRTPQCVRDARLRPAAGPDVCEMAGPPACPLHSKLKPAKGEDRCYY